MNPLKTGTILHGKSYDYKIIQTLGQGTFGITYLASVKMTGALGSIDSEILVAVKEFFMRDFNGRNGSSVTYSSKDGAYAYYKSKFVHEATNLSNLHDPGIIKVIELFEENQTAYYVMEYISQGSLDNHIKSKGHLSSTECVTFAIQIAKALGYMHKNNMLHLDLKPKNIMIKGNNEIVLIDFGLSKRFDSNGNPETSTTIGHGTPGYSPIEQANYQGNMLKKFPASMDIYALGATMFKMLTGQRPPEASIVLNEGFPFYDLRNYGVSESLGTVVAKCMEPLRKNRYKSTEEIIDALNSIELLTENFGSETTSKDYYKKNQKEEELTIDNSKDIRTELFVVPDDTYEVTVNYDPCQIGLKKREAGYQYIFNENRLPRTFKSFLNDLNNLGILTGPYKNGNYEYSEESGSLIIEFKRKRDVPICLSLFASNTDKLAGNIYDANIHDLAELIDNIWLKYLPYYESEPTQELIYSIPESTSEIWIDYNKGGFVGQDNTTTRIRLGNIKKSVISSKYKYVYNTKEFKEVVDGLTKLKLRSQYRSYEEPSTGIMFPTLTITLYDSEGKKIKEFFAQNNGDRIIGDIALPVDSLKYELIKISSSFEKELSNSNNNTDTKTHSWSDVIFFSILVALGIAIFAVPLYLFLRPTDALFNWLWLSIGITEISILPIIISLKYNNERLDNISFGGFIIGIMAFIAYVVLWIIQMCKWWI